MNSKLCERVSPHFIFFGFVIWCPTIMSVRSPVCVAVCTYEHHYLGEQSGPQEYRKGVIFCIG